MVTVMLSLCLGCGRICWLVFRPSGAGCVWEMPPQRTCPRVLGSWCPLVVHYVGGHVWEWCHRPPGWPEGWMLSCVDHCHQNCLSHREQGRVSGCQSLEAVSRGSCRLSPRVLTPAERGLGRTAVFCQAHTAGKLVSARAHTTHMPAHPCTHHEPPTRRPPASCNLC